MAGALAFLAMWLAPAPSTLDAAAIQAVVQRAMPALRRCGDDITGPLTFTIGPNGAVIATKGGTPCVARVLRRMHFPAPGESVEVSLPLAVDPT